MKYRSRQLPPASPPSHPRGSADVRLLEALVDAVIAHGQLDDGALADFESAVMREQDRLAGQLRDEWDADAEEVRVEMIYRRAQLTPQERRAIQLAGEGWSSKQIAHEMAPVRPRRRYGLESWPLPIETVERYLRRAKAKLRPYCPPIYT